MLTREQCVQLGNEWGHATLYHGRLRNSDGSPLRCRVNGRCKVWKTRPTEFQLPCKHGLRDCFYITQNNAHEWFMTEQEARSAEVLSGGNK